MRKSILPNYLIVWKSVTTNSGRFEAKTGGLTSGFVGGLRPCDRLHFDFLLGLKGECGRKLSRCQPPAARRIERGDRVGRGSFGGRAAPARGIGSRLAEAPFTEKEKHQNRVIIRWFLEFLGEKPAAQKPGSAASPSGNLAWRHRLIGQLRQKHLSYRAQNLVSGWQWSRETHSQPEGNESGVPGETETRAVSRARTHPRAWSIDGRHPRDTPGLCRMNIRGLSASG